MHQVGQRGLLIVAARTVSKPPQQLSKQRTAAVALPSPENQMATEARCFVTHGAVFRPCQPQISRNLLDTTQPKAQPIRSTLRWSDLALALLYVQIHGHHSQPSCNHAVPSNRFCALWKDSRRCIAVGPIRALDQREPEALTMRKLLLRRDFLNRTSGPSNGKIR